MLLMMLVYAIFFKLDYDLFSLSRRKSLGLSGNKRSLELSLSESSRKFITCVRKYMLFYLNLLEKTGDLWTLDRAYVYLKTDKRVFVS